MVNRERREALRGSFVKMGHMIGWHATLLGTPGSLKKSKNNFRGITIGIGPIWGIHSLSFYPILVEHSCFKVCRLSLCRLKNVSIDLFTIFFPISNSSKSKTKSVIFYSAWPSYCRLSIIFAGKSYIVRSKSYISSTSRMFYTTSPIFHQQVIFYATSRTFLQKVLDFFSKSYILHNKSFIFSTCLIFLQHIVYCTQRTVYFFNKSYILRNKLYISN